MNQLVKQFGGEKRWLSWKPVKKDGKVTKVPIGSSTDPETWSTFESLSGDLGKGIVFTPDKQLLGVDIDHCLKNNIIEHEEKESIEKLIREATTYTEISPSGEGLHLFLALDEALELTSNKKSPFEAYTSGRYFTFTGEVFGADTPVRQIGTEEALRLLSIIGYPWKTEGSLKKEAASGGVQLEQGKLLGPVDDLSLLDLMFKSKNGEGIKRLYDGELTRHNDDASIADMSLCSHLAFWTRGDYAQIERIWLGSALGSREKTQKRADYRKRTIEAALAKCTEYYTPAKAKSLEALPDKIEFLFTTHGKEQNKVYTLNTENICRILRQHEEFKERLRYDEFRNIFEIKVGNTWRPLEDADAIMVQTRISILYDFFQKIGKDMAYDAIIKVGKENNYDSAADFIRGLEWDGTARLDSWLSQVYGAPNDKYHQAVGANWLKGLVKRIVQPGCKFDFVLVLEGEQGAKKSTSLGILGGEWHVETTMSTESKDFFMQFQGKAIIEFSEGETFSRTEVKRMKAIITMQSDKYRPPYERVSKDFPRRCVFAMTTNQEEYLKDETGNRRWLPVKVLLPQANIEWLEENRNQLFAEAHHRVAILGEKIYEFPIEETLQAQEARRISDPNADIITEWYWSELSDQQRAEGITVNQVYIQVFHNGFSAGKPKTKAEEMSIAGVLKNTLKLFSKRELKEGVRVIRWYPGTLQGAIIGQSVVF